MINYLIYLIGPKDTVIFVVINSVIIDMGNQK